MAAVNTGPNATSFAGTRDWINWDHLVEFIVTPGPHATYEEWNASFYRSERTLVREVRVAAMGDAEEVRLVLDQMMISLTKSDRMVFERPANLLTMTSENRDADMEERVLRLEHMMNVLVEQDSAAGEALRRLGGASFSFSLPSQLQASQLLAPRESMTVRMRTMGGMSATKNAVTVRISLSGLACMETS